MKTKACIVGCGFVGSALENCFKKSVELLKIDPKLDTNIRDIETFLPEIIFICVPTPMKQNGDQDIKILESVIKEICDLKITCPIIIKSTVLPNNIERVIKKSNSIIYNPEFLREKHAEKDLIDAKFHIFGGNTQVCKHVSNFYKKNTITNGEHIYLDAVAASFLKFTINSFLSLKVTFFNELFDLFQKTSSEYSWQEFIDILKKDKRIGESHLNVPGHDNRRGYGGACFPKDSNAFYNFSIEKESELSLLKKSIDINNKYRSRYNTATNREIEQNISFKSKKENN